MKVLSPARALVLGGLVASVLVTRTARAEGEHARLRYEVDDPRGVCPDEVTFRARVASRLGYDAFRDDASLELRVTIAARAATVTGSITSLAPGKPSGKRTLEDPRCDALVEAAASAVALVLDPVAASSSSSPRSEPEAAPLPPPPSGATDSSGAVPPPATITPRAERPPVEPPPEGIRGIFVLADVTAGFARTPAAMLGARVGVGLRRDLYAIAFEGRAETSPGDVAIGPRDRVEATAFSGAVAGCRHFEQLDRLALCGVASAGVREVKALDVAVPAATRSPFLVLGLRLGLELPLGSALALRANGEVGASLLRDTYTTDGVARTTTSVVEASLGTGLVGVFR